MGRPKQSLTLGVWMNGEHVGDWTQKRAGGPEEFSYTTQWLRSTSRRPISLSLPLGPEGTVYKGPTVTCFFDNLLPDTKEIRERLRQRFDARSLGAFDLLAQLGRDCVGAIQILPAGEAPSDIHQINGRMLNSEDIERLLQQVTGTPLGRDFDEEEFRISIAGAQEKTALLRIQDQWMLPTGATPTTHILKLPIGQGGNGIDLSTSVENEWLCSKILAAYGIPVAPCEMAVFGEQKVLIVERFDRRLSSDRRWIARLPQEDLCQATGTAGDQKYEADGGPGIKTIMDLLLGSSAAEADRLDFFRTQVLFWMLCAIDGHGKNFSLHIEAGGGYRLTPRYDVMSAYPVLGNGTGKIAPKKAKMAMAVDGENRHYRWEGIQHRHWIDTARRCGLGKQIDELTEQLVSATPTVVAKVEAEVPSGFPAYVAEPVLAGLAATASRLQRISDR